MCGQRTTKVSKRVPNHYTKLRKTNSQGLHGRQPLHEDKSPSAICASNSKILESHQLQLICCLACETAKHVAHITLSWAPCPPIYQQIQEVC